MSRSAFARSAITLVSLFGLAVPLLAQGVEPAKVPFPTTSPDLTMAGVEYFRQALWSLPLAAALGAALALRPRRRGQPPRSSAVIQTQILLAVIGALVLLVHD